MNPEEDKKQETEDLDELLSMRWKTVCRLEGGKEVSPG